MCRVQRIQRLQQPEPAQTREFDRDSPLLAERLAKVTIVAFSADRIPCDERTTNS